jgi:hypothetical protein
LYRYSKVERKRAFVNAAKAAAYWVGLYTCNAVNSVDP